jgi:hypothetical protein
VKTFVGFLVLLFAAQSRDAFDVASIKPAGEASVAAMTRFGGGCDGGFPRVERNRFTATTTLYALMTWAYGFNNRGGCSFVSYGDFISGGPTAFRRSKNIDDLRRFDVGNSHAQACRGSNRNKRRIHLRCRILRLKTPLQVIHPLRLCLRLFRNN